jgi:hypothetical protein
MRQVLIDPSLRRARIVRVTVGALALLALAIAAVFVREVRARPRAAPPLRSPRHAPLDGTRRPVTGRRPGAGYASGCPSVARFRTRRKGTAPEEESVSSTAAESGNRTTGVRYADSAFGLKPNYWKGAEPTTACLLRWSTA